MFYLFNYFESLTYKYFLSSLEKKNELNFKIVINIEIVGLRSKELLLCSTTNNEHLGVVRSLMWTVCER